MLEGQHIVPAHLDAVHLYAVGIIFPENDPSDILDNLALARGHCIQPLAAARVRLPDDIFANSALGKSGEGALQG